MVTVTAFLSFLSVFLNVVLGYVSAQSNCTRPQNAIRVDFSKLKGVWYVHELANAGLSHAGISCSRIEFFEGPDESLIATETYYETSTGELALPRVLEITEDDEGVLKLANLKDKGSVFYYYSLKLTDDVYVASFCYTQDDIVKIAAASILFSRNQIEDQDRIDSEFKSVGVEVQNYYAVPQDSCVLGPPQLFILLRPLYVIWRSIW